MAEVNPYAYTITIQGIEDEGERVFEATVAELPDMADYAETFRDAYDLAIQTIQGAAELYAESGREFPKPQKHEKEYSGRVTLRMPKTIHAKVDRIAGKEGVSLNQFLVSIISERVGHSTACDRFDQIAENYLRRAWSAMTDSWAHLSSVSNQNMQTATTSFATQNLSLNHAMTFDEKTLVVRL